MANSSIDTIDDAEALRRLREFFRQMDNLLGDFAEGRIPAINPRHLPRMRNAFAEVRPKFDLVIESLKEPQASNALSDLRDVGLTGAQLVFKLSVFDHAHDELVDHLAIQGRRREKGTWWKRLFRLVTPTLKAADVILGSAAIALKPIEVIKEIKESIESGVDIGREYYRMKK